VSRDKKRIKKTKPKRIERKLEPGVRRIPWNELTPEEQRNLEGFFREEKRWQEQEKARWGDFNWTEAGRIIDRAIAIRDGLIPPPWAARQGKTRRSKSKPGSAAAWIDELHPKNWHLVTAGKIHQEAASRGSKLSLRAFQHELQKRRRG
jgi:hypothetical protein